MGPNKDKENNSCLSDSLANCEKLVSKLTLSQPSLKNLTKGNYGKPKETPNVLLESLGAPHVGSFDFMLDKGLTYAVEDLDVVEFLLPPDCGGQKVSLRMEDARLMAPAVPNGVTNVMDQRVFPSEARQRGTSYKGKCIVKVSYAINGINQPQLEKSLGNLPIMLKSSACHLKGLSPQELIERGEQESEWGGYFVIGGHERLIRMLQTTRRNFPVAMQRPSWKNRGRNFSDLGVAIDCCKPDLTTIKNVLHFVTTGTAKFMFNVGRELFFVPVVMILKSLCDRSDAYIYEQLCAGTDPEDHYFRGCLKNMLNEPQEEGLFASDQIREYIGQSFRERVKYLVPEWYSNIDICNYLMRKSVLVHLEQNEDKFNLIVLMIKKLFQLVQEKCVVEGVDCLMMHEIVLGGHLYLQLLKEKLENWLLSLKASILKKAKALGNKFDLTPMAMQGCLQQTISLERQFENFLGTGNLPSITGLGLMQNKGLTIMAENINRMRYMSHFRAIHRGSFFQEMRTTEVRALLPDAWGFVCPVHTPDGAPCGLLNHLTMSVYITTEPEDSTRIPAVLLSLGLIPVGGKMIPSDAYPVMLDGKVMGYFDGNSMGATVEKLRTFKVNPNDDRISAMTELAFVPRKRNGQFPGLFIFTGAARMMRPVLNLALKAVEWIGTFEQVYLDITIANWDKEDLKLNPTHQELNKTSFLSNLARTIPLPDFNQSPRNMYQCQMGKQTMATPTHTWHLNAETKMYRLQTPTSPLFRPYHYDAIGMDDYAMGTNAIVAVISYTGYDMEDAMIINRASIERGFAYGTVYKSHFIDLFTVDGGRKPRNPLERELCDLVFERDPKKPFLNAFLDADGLPLVGTRLTEGDPMYCYRNDSEATYVIKKYEGKEVAYVDNIKLCGNDTGSGLLNRVNISLRIQRPPSIGDKFASRAGQKGICSQQWPSEDLPWTESGLIPDIVFNPHGFPSRMTIAMMVECMAGKSGANHGLCHDATPFRYVSDDLKDTDAINHFGKQLEAAGYNYYGTETLYSGTDGIQMTADIFFGIIHYQRLRHMVSDKFQVRSQGPVDMVTRQPIKGRRRGGGVRFGEMERDCLLSHGSVFLLQDRLFHGSDKTRVKVCIKCGSLLSPRVAFPATKNAVPPSMTNRFRELKSECLVCQEGASTVRDLAVPYVFLHLVSQLAAVNIKIRVETKYE